jgi:D-alanyl-D-alanine carboxypeptidase/D-alanyl-D-alanine-endopeptidase (penicillin-binding protein 4)
MMPLTYNSSRMIGTNNLRFLAARLVIALLLFPFHPASAIAQQQTGAEGKPQPKPQTLTELQARIAASLDQPQFASARWGARIITTQGSTVFERDADKLFMPASSMKLYTTAAALDAFGPDFKFKTSVYATRPTAAGGVLRGDLILYGRGDPNLSARFEQGEKIDEFTPAERIGPIEALADQIQARGIRRITGDLIGDDSYFATDWLGAGWEWDDAQFYYGAEVSALAVNDNVVTFNVAPAKRAGAAPTITVEPETAYVKIINHVTTSGNGQTRIGVHRPLGSNTVEFFGTIPRTIKEHRVNIAIHDPASFAATLLREALARRGIRVLGRIRRLDTVARLAQPLDEAKLTEVANVSSQPLSVLLKVINKPSQNLHTEIMLRQLGVRRGGAAELDDYGRPRSAEARGLEVLRRFLQAAGIETERLSLRDGSGLSRHNLITPRATVRLLEFMAAHPHSAVYRDSLPVAGVDGTLERRLRDTAAAGNVRAKTGTLSYVNAISGYLTTKRGQMLIFSLMGNNYTGPGREVTAVFDQICVMLAEYEGEL